LKIRGRVNGDGSTSVTITLLPEELRRVMEMVGDLTGSVFAGRNDNFDNAIEAVLEFVRGRERQDGIDLVLRG